MAGQAEKKLAARAEEGRKVYLYIIIGVNVAYFLLRIVWRWSTFFRWNQAGFLLFSAVSYFTFGAITRSLELGMDSEYYKDLYIVNLATQALVSFSNYGWLLYLLVPGYLGFQIVKMLLNYVFTPTAEEMAENDSNAKKKAEKKAAKAEKPKVKYMKR
mmetsp:Transcript_66946/g.131953  ORF Transcript_66946/g.131953 Transcript_66946/m.131953 type:complete len:158 (-) Transcript_66946:43-516(-)